MNYLEDAFHWALFIMLGIWTIVAVAISILICVFAYVAIQWILGLC